jgi:surface carbohydrate biosynthesis protein
MKIALILDNPRRELDGILLVAYHLIRRGHDVYVVPMYQQGHDVPWLEADAVIVNYARPDNGGFLASCRTLGTRVVVLDNEGGVVPEQGARTPYGPDALRANGLHAHIDEYLFWGTAQYEHFRARSPLPLERLHVTGCPRYDFCHPRWRRALGYERRDFVLINTNFSAINPLYTGSAAKERERFRAAGWDMEHTDAYLRELALVFRAYLEDLHALAAQNPDLHFVVRPHPFEAPQVYGRRFADRPNVSVDGRGSAIAMIGNARCVIQLNCQTAVETLLMGKLSISLEYLNSPGLRERYALPSAISYPAASLAEVGAMLRTPEAYAGRLPMNELWRNHVEPLFYKDDGQAALRVAEQVEAMGAAPVKAGHFARLRRSLTGSHHNPTLVRRLQGAAANAAGSRLVAGLRSLLDRRRGTKYASRSDVSRGLGAIAAADAWQGSWECRHARHPLSGLPLATLHLRKAA